MAPRHPAERTFGGDVHGVGLHRTEAPRDAAEARQRQPDLRIGRAGERVELVRRQHRHLDAERRQLDGEPLVRAHDAVDLRVPSVGRNEDAHHATWSASASCAAVRALRSATTSCQRISSKVPSLRLADRRAAFHPVAGVEVVDALDVARGGVVDVSADDAVDVVAPGFVRQRLLELADEVDGRLDAQLQVRRQRPVAEAEAAADEVQRMVHPQRQLVAAVAEEGEPLGIAHDDVELVAVDDEVALAVGRRVHRLVLDLDAAEVLAAVLAQAFVVVAGDEHDARALAHLAQQLLQHVVVRLRPDGAAADAPEVDDVADEVDGVGVGLLEEVEEQVGLRRARPEVDVGDEKSAVLDHAHPFELPMLLGFDWAPMTGFKFQYCDSPTADSGGNRVNGGRPVTRSHACEGCIAAKMSVSKP